MTSPRPVPTGFSPHTERNATILLPVQDKPFLNPIQEYNRDLSVAVIRQWARTREDEAKAKWDKRKAKRDQGQGKGKGKAGKLVTGGDSEQAGEKLAAEQIGESSDARYLGSPEISRARQRLKEDLPPRWPWRQSTTRLPYNLSRLQHPFLLRQAHPPLLQKPQPPRWRHRPRRTLAQAVDRTTRTSISRNVSTLSRR